MKSELNDIKRQVALNTQMLQALSSGSVETNDELEVQLPLQNSQALDQLEEQLLRDDQLRKSLVSMSWWCASRCWMQGWIYCRRNQFLCQLGFKLNYTNIWETFIRKKGIILNWLVDIFHAVT